MRILIFLFITASIFACKGPNSPEEKAVEAQTRIYENNPTDSTAQALVQALSKYVEVHGLKDSTSARYIIKAARVSSDHNQWSQALGFYKTYMIHYPARADQADHLVSVIAIIDTLNKPELSQVLYKSFTERFPDDERAAAFLNRVEKKNITVDSMLKEIGLKMFNDSIYRLDENMARLYVDACEAAVMANPNLPDAPEYLHRAAETARTLRDIPKAITLYDWIIEQYPNHQRGATSLFLKAFTFDNDLKDFDNARIYYEEFLKKHPNNEFAESAEFLLENLGKSEAELKEILDRKSKEHQMKEKGEG